MDTTGAPLVSQAAIGGPTTSSWREQALTRIAELENLTDVFATQAGLSEADRVLADRTRRHLVTARDAAQGEPGRSVWKKIAGAYAGSSLERTASNIDAAEADLLRLAPEAYVAGQIPSLLAHVRSHLQADDPRAERLEQLAKRPVYDFSESERDSIVAAVRAASSAARREIVQVRSFRSILWLTATLLTLAAIALAALGYARPSVLPLCFTPETEASAKVVCPTAETAIASSANADDVMRATAGRWDILTAEILGLIAAAVAAATALRSIRGTSTPYSLPVALALLKLPLGALTAVLGLLLMRGNFVPGLSALDTPGQVLAWAILFGYAQQVFTRFVDQQAHNVLDNAGSGAPEPATAGTAPGRPLGGAATPVRS
jgi:hypothetical protein